MSSAPVLSNSVSIVLDRERHLRFDFNALVAIEKVTGRNMLSDGSWSNLTASVMRSFIWAALIHEDAALTLDQVGAMIQTANLKYVSEKLSEAITESMPKDTDPQTPAATQIQ